VGVEVLEGSRLGGDGVLVAQDVGVAQRQQRLAVLVADLRRLAGGRLRGDLLRHLQDGAELLRRRLEAVQHFQGGDLETERVGVVLRVGGRRRARGRQQKQDGQRQEASPGAPYKGLPH